MANASRKTPSEVSDTTGDSFQLPFVYSSAFVDSVLQVQRIQLEALLSWQQSVAAVAQEMWDEWACRFAGGAPIDA